MLQKERQAQTSEGVKGGVGLHSSVDVTEYFKIGDSAVYQSSRKFTYLLNENKKLKKQGELLPFTPPLLRRK
ncbi:MAG: hypothetical protein H8D23_20440 [Candidatus Brocadiales bacterium]|nr:hypothetical protein [Candidatus Brocadiales bacterium]